MSALLVGILGIVLFLILAFLRLPVGMAMMAAGFLGYWYLEGLSPALNTLGTIPYRVVTTYIFTCLPPFILMGELAFRSGLSVDAYEMASRWLGRFRGGLAMATVGASAAFSSVTGSSLACALTMVNMSLPEMRRRGYSDLLIIGTIATGSILGPMIPPSTVFIQYSYLTETSLADLFVGGIMPGILLAVLYIIAIIIWVKVNPSIATAGTPSSWREKLTGFPALWAIAVVFAACIGGMYLGIFTATEAGAIGAFAVWVVAMVRRKLSLKSFNEALLSTGRTTGAIMIIVMGAIVFNQLLSVSRVPWFLADSITAFNLPPLGVMCVILIFYIITGFFMDCMAVVFVTCPIFFPVIVQLGFDPVWFGVMICALVGLGGITPPYGMIIFALSGMVKDIPMWTMFRGCFPFIFANVAGIIILLMFPQIAYWLPYLGKPV